MIDLSVITINFNTSSLIRGLLDSLEGLMGNLKYEIFVIDNKSSRSDREKLRKNVKKYKNLNLAENSKNLGFGKANNIGIRRSSGKYILLLNPDTYADKIDFGEIIKWMDKNPNVGAMSCKLKNRDGSIQGTGGYFPTLFRVFFWMFFLDNIPLLNKLNKPFHPQHPRSPLNNDKFYSKLISLDWITGAFFLIRRSSIPKGGFDENFFMYGEDVDLSKRIKEAGYDIIYNPFWSIIHLGGQSSDNSYPIITEFNGVKLFYKKYMPQYQYPILRVILLVGIIFRFVLFGILGNKSLATTYAKSIKII